MKFAIVSLLCVATVSALPQAAVSPGQPLPGMPGSLPGSPPVMPNNPLPGLPNNNLPGLPQQPGLGPQPGIGGLPQQPLKKRGIESGEQFRQFSLPAGFSPPSPFSPPTFGNSNSPIFMTVTPPKVKRNADKLEKFMVASTPSVPPRVKRGLFGGDEPTPVSVSILPATVTTGLPRVKRNAVGNVNTTASTVTGSPRMKRGIFGSDPVSTGAFSVPTVTPISKRR